MEQTYGAHVERLQRVREAIRQGDSLAAIVLLKAHLTVAPESAVAEELLGIAHAQAGNRAQALAALSRASQLDPRRASVHYNLALLLDEDGELDDAIEEVNTALFIKADYSAARGLHESLIRKLRDRAHRSHSDFTVLDSGRDPLAETEGEWAKLQCVSCHAMNFITARTCSRCGSYLPEVKDIVPVE